jgi:hypothetical protein
LLMQPFPDVAALVLSLLLLLLPGHHVPARGVHHNGWPRLCCGCVSVVVTRDVLLLVVVL